MNDTATETARLARHAKTPEGQHAFITVVLMDGDQMGKARYPVEVAGSDQVAYDDADAKATETADFGPLMGYVLEVNRPADMPPFDEPGPDPARILKAYRMGYSVERRSRGWHFIRPDGHLDSEAFGNMTDAWIQACGDSGLWESDHGETISPVLASIIDEIIAYEEPEEDGDIVEAFSNFQNRLKAARAMADVAAATIYISRSENDLDIWSPAPIPGLEIVKLNYDIDDIRNYSADDVTMVRFEATDAFEPCLVSTDVLTGSGRVPEMRPATESDMGDDA